MFVTWYALVRECLFPVAAVIIASLTIADIVIVYVLPPWLVLPCSLHVWFGIKTLIFLMMYNTKP